MIVKQNKTNILRFCSMCNTEIEEKNFYESMNPHHGCTKDKDGNIIHMGKMLYCKDHCDKINKELKEKYHDDMKALWYTCAMLDVPFVLDVFKKFSENKENSITKREEQIDKTTGKKKYTPKENVEFANGYKDFAYYYDLLKNKCKPSITQDWTTFESGTDVDWKDVSKNITELDVKQSDKEKYILDWGLQDSMDDYEFLDNCYAKYTKDVTMVNATQEDLYRDLCRDRLLLRKINDKRSNEDVDKISIRIRQNMKTLNIDNFDNNKPKSLSEQSFFAKISQVEMFEPADFYKEGTKYYDESGARKYEKDMSLRPLLNTLCGHKDFDINMDDVEKYDIRCKKQEGKL